MRKPIQKILPKLIGSYFNSLSLVAPRKAGEQAFLLFSTPQKGRALPHQEPFLNAAKYKRHAVKNLQIQSYHWPGSGPKVLLVHGWESNTYRWKALIEHLQQEDYDIYAFDAPAQGKSDGKLLNAVRYTHCLEQMVDDLQPEIIIGHSVGAMTTLYRQYLRPAPEIKQLVLLGPPGELQEIMADYQKICQLKPRVMRALEDYTQTTYGFSFDEFSAPAFAKAVTQQGLLIHDKHDPVTPISASRNIHAVWPESELIETEGLGHSLHDPRVYQMITSFLQKAKAS
ncbi:alpha/beta fold hydrolase [Croceiramulus getboli]|nr:alpha/beta fold hydrolase [Flavobacteriaceae bacterium YJPT1-3]